MARFKCTVVYKKASGGTKTLKKTLNLMASNCEAAEAEAECYFPSGFETFNIERVW